MSGENQLALTLWEGASASVLSRADPDRDMLKIVATNVLFITERAFVGLN